jgi:hypothetical protein
VHTLFASRTGRRVSLGVWWCRECNLRSCKPPTACRSRQGVINLVRAVSRAADRLRNDSHRVRLAGSKLSFGVFLCRGVRGISICDRGPVINYAANWKSDERSICKLPACLSIISLPRLFSAVELKISWRACDERSRKFFCQLADVRISFFLQTVLLDLLLRCGEKLLGKLCGSSWPDTIIRCVPCNRSAANQTNSSEVVQRVYFPYGIQLSLP